MSLGAQPTATANSTGGTSMMSSTGGEQETIRLEAVAMNPQYMASPHGCLNFLQFVIPLVIMLSDKLADMPNASGAPFLVSFTYCYTCFIMQFAGCISPFSQAYLPHSMYFLMFHTLGSAMYAVSANMYLYSEHHASMWFQTCALGSIIASCVHFLHASMAFTTFFKD